MFLFISNKIKCLDSTQIRNQSINLSSSSSVLETDKVVYFSTYSNPLYSTSDLSQIHHTTPRPIGTWFYSCFMDLWPQRQCVCLLMPSLYCTRAKYYPGLDVTVHLCLKLLSYQTLRTYVMFGVNKLAILFIKKRINRKKIYSADHENR